MSRIKEHIGYEISPDSYVEQYLYENQRLKRFLEAQKRSEDEKKVSSYKPQKELPR